MPNPLFTPEELAELAAFDAEVEKEEITRAEIEESRSRDKDVMFERKNDRERRIAARKREYQAANKEKIAAYQREYQAANKEKIAAYQREYQAANKEKIAARKREYRAANKEKIAAYQREYRAANKEKLAAYQREYRATKRIKKALASAPPPTRADQRSKAMIPRNRSYVQ